LLPDIYPVVVVLFIHPSRIHPFKFLIPKEEDDERRRGGPQMAVAAVYYSKIILKENLKINDKK
jgi:hypothetical protein